MNINELVNPALPETPSGPSLLSMELYVYAEIKTRPELGNLLDKL
jgi:hypothetical protein